MNILKQDKAHDHTDNSRLLAEIQKLQAENNELRDKNIVINCAMTDLNTQLKEAENEKKSLITALRVLQADLVSKHKSEHAISIDRQTTVVQENQTTWRETLHSHLILALTYLKA